MTTEPKVLGVPQAATLLGLSERGLRHILERGEFPGYKLGRRWFVPVAAIDEAIERAMRTTTEP